MVEASPFLSEAWERKSQVEKGEKTLEEKEASIYLDLKTASGKNEVFSEVFSDLERDALHYAERVRNFELKRFGGLEGDKAEIQAADLGRKMAHESLVADLNALSRQFRQTGLNNDWRSEIGFTREAEGHFAITVADLLCKKLLKNTE